jgi:hypothetical protein
MDGLKEVEELKLDGGTSDEEETNKPIVAAAPSQSQAASLFRNSFARKVDADGKTTPVKTRESSASGSDPTSPLSPEKTATTIPAKDEPSSPRPSRKQDNSSASSNNNNSTASGGGGGGGMPTLLIRNPFRFGGGNSQGTNLGSNKTKDERSKSAGGPLAGLNNLRKSTLGRICSVPKDGIGRQQQQEEEEEESMSFD